MNRKLIIASLGILSALPAFAHTTQFPAASALPAQPAQPAQPGQPVLRLMNEDEFAAFLGRLDSQLVRSQEQLKKMDVRSVSADADEKLELEKSHARCLESLDNTRNEIQRLSQKQTLKLDLFLLIELNQLARNLDALDEGLMNPSPAANAAGAHKSLGYARDVLQIDSSLASQISTFQQHFIAFTGVVDASMDEPEADASQPPVQK
jgi:hypothetical protein